MLSSVGGKPPVLSVLLPNPDMLSSQFLGGGPLVAALQPRSFNHLVGA